MAISDDFTVALLRLAGGAGADAGLLPTALTRACVEVLGVDGASLGLMSEQVRMPLGADSEMSARAEQLQFTLGDGPCLEASRTRQAGNFPAGEIARRWPLYARRLADETPYRSCATFPLDLGDGLVGAVDLYSNSPDGLPDPVMDDGRTVVAGVAHTLLADAVDADAEHGPAWLHSEPVRARANLWVAIGLLLQFSGLTVVELMAVIRAHAFGRGRTIDEVTQALVTRSLDPRAVLDG